MKIRFALKFILALLLADFFPADFSAADFSVAQTASVQTVSMQTASTYERVMRSNELRCGYAIWPGLVEKDPNTGKLSGAFYEYMQELGAAMEIKIVWAEEVSFGDIVESLKSRRVDAVCSGVWTNAVRGKFVDFTTPISYQQVGAVVRADDLRFDGDLSRINSPAVTISVVDGESADTIAQTDFPQAKALSMPSGTEMSQMILNVVHKKADITFADAGLIGDFQAKNPGTLRKVPVKFPVRVFGNVVVVAKGESALKEAIDSATKQLLWTGKIERILTTNERHPGMFLRAVLPFEVASIR